MSDKSFDRDEWLDRLALQKDLSDEEFLSAAIFYRLIGESDENRPDTADTRHQERFNSCYNSG